MGQTNFADHRSDFAEPDDMPPAGQIERPDQVMALLASKQFDVIYESPYRGEEDRIISLMHMCESLCQAITDGQSQQGLENGVHMLDSTLMACLPAQEVRTIIATIVNKDPGLIKHMPQIRKMLWRVYRAVELSVILDPKVLGRIAADVTSQNKWGGVGG